MADGVLRSMSDLAPLRDAATRSGGAGGVTVGGRPVLLSAPFAFGTEGTDILRTRLWTFGPRAWPTGGRVFQLVVRAVRADGTGQVSDLDLSPVTDLVVFTDYLRLDAGALQTIALTWAGANTPTMPGITYAVVDLLRGTPEGAKKVIGTLVAGYVGPGQTLTWPGSPILGPQEGPGFPLSVNYGAILGAEVNVPAPQWLVWRVRSIYMELTTSAAAVNRRSHLYFFNGGVLTGYLPSQAEVGASLHVYTVWMPGAALAAGHTDLSGVAPMPAGMYLRYNDSVRTSTLGLQPGDQYTAVTINGDVWIEPLP